MGNVEQPDIDRQKSIMLLRISMLKEETEGVIKLRKIKLWAQATLKTPY